MKKLTKVISTGACVLLLLGAVLAGTLSEADSNAGFGAKGVVITDFGFGDDQAYDLAVQQDGKIVVAGSSSNGAVRNMAVARYLSDGTLDPDFNNGGRATFSLGAGDSVARSISLQKDGKIVLAGSTVDTDADIAVLRLNSDGTPDPSFGNGGQLIISQSGGDETAYSVQTASDGSIYLAGTATGSEAATNAFVAKIDGSGALDSGFGDGGIATLQRSYATDARSLVFARQR